MLDCKRMACTERKEMTFDITFMLFIIVILLAIIAVSIMAYPGPKKSKS